LVAAAEEEAVPTRASIAELKRKLDGRVLRYECEALAVSARRAVVLYRPQQPVELADVPVPPGAVSFGLYWTDRPYNIYRWVDSAGATVACYCNVAAETRISRTAVEWLDLEADVLVMPDARVRVLDLEEVPADLAPAYQAALAEALTRLSDGEAVLAEAERATRRFRVT
jgi:hypothetical protein